MIYKSLVVVFIAMALIMPGFSTVFADDMVFYAEKTEDISDAVEAAGEGETRIILTDDLDYGERGNTSSSGGACLIIPEGKNIVLDMNGHSIKAELKTGKSNYSSVQIILNEGTLAIIDGSGYGGGLISNEYDMSYACTRTIKNTGDLTINDVTVRSRGAVAILNLGTCEIYGSNTAVESLREDTVVSWDNAASAIENRTLGAAFDSTLIIRDGKVTSKSQSAIYCDSPKAAYTVYGGLIQGNQKYGAVNGSAAKTAGKALGGVWSSDPSKIVEEGYTMEKTVDGYKVQKMKEPEEIYVSSEEELADAIENATYTQPVRAVITDSMTLTRSLELPERSEIVTEDGVKFVIGEDSILTQYGTIINNGSIRVDGFLTDPLNMINNGTIKNYPGDGKKFVIDSPMDLQWLAYAVENDPKEWMITVEDDIEMPEGVVFQTIGGKDGLTDSVFNGQGHKISGLVIRNDMEYTGMFSSLKNSVIKNFTVELDAETDSSYIGGIAGQASGGTVFENIIVKGSVRAEGASSGCGGIAGKAGDDDGVNEPVEFISCQVEAAVDGRESLAVGAVIGTGKNSRDDIELYNCSSSGIVIGKRNAGYILGYGYMMADFNIINFSSTLSDTNEPVGYMAENIPFTISEEYYAVKDENGWKYVENTDEIRAGFEAKKDGTEYTTLEAAVSDAKAGDTVMLLRDMESSLETRRITIKENIVLDGGGHKIKGDISLKIDGTDNIEIRNMVFEDIHSERERNSVNAISAIGLRGRLDINGCVFTACDPVNIMVYPGEDAYVSITGNVFDNGGRGDISGFIRIDSVRETDFSAFVSENVMKGSTSRNALEVSFPSEADKVRLSENCIESLNKVCVLDGSGRNISERAYPMSNEKFEPLYDDVVLLKDDTGARAYGSLYEAVLSSESGDELMLLENIYVRENIEIPEEVMLVSNGKTIFMEPGVKLTVPSDMKIDIDLPEGYKLISSEGQAGDYVYSAEKDAPVKYGTGKENGYELDEKIKDKKENETKVTSAMTDTFGNMTETTEKQGMTVINVSMVDGTKVNTVFWDNGVCASEIIISKEATESGEIVTLPISPVTAAENQYLSGVIFIEIEDGKSAMVEIPVQNMTSGTVGVLLDHDNGDRMIKNTLMGERGIVLKVDGEASVNIINNETEFQDVKDTYWGKDAVDYVVSRGFFAGVNETMFYPDSPMSRAMLMTVLAEFDGQQISGGTVWYDKALQWAMETGISDGTDPEKTISRQEFVSMLYRYASSPDVAGDLESFSDGEYVSAYAEKAMVWAVNNGIISGIGNGILDPAGETTRAQAASMIMRFAEAMGKRI